MSKKFKPVDSIDELMKSLSKDANVKVVDTKDEFISTELIKTGFPTLDYVSHGGLPKGKLIRLAGEEGSGKSTLAKQMAPLFGRNILYVDTEYAYDQNNTDLVVNKDSYDEFRLVSAASTERVCDIIIKSIPFFDVIIWDSLQNTASEEEWGKTASEFSRANRAGVLSRMLPKIMFQLDKNNSTLIVVSQVSMNQDKMNKYDEDYVVSGGKRLDHNVYLDIWLYKSTKEKSKTDTKFGSKIVNSIDSRVVCKKVRNAPTYRKGRLTIPYDEDYKGFTPEEDIFRCAEELNIITTAGRFKKYKGETIGGSKQEAKDRIKNDKELQEQLYKEVYDALLSEDKEEDNDN